MTACAIDPVVDPESTGGKIICGSYIVMDMCVRDLINDDQVDMIYFTDTEEVFMYRDGLRDVVREVMPLHRCAVVLTDHMQATTNRILERENLSLSEELSVTRALIKNYMETKPEIEACNARFDGEDGVVKEPEEEFYVDEMEWED